MNVKKRCWELEQAGFSPVRELSLESLFTTGNGIIAVRGSVDFPLPASQPDLLVAGLYGKKAEHLPYSDTTLISIERRNSDDAELIPLPSPFPFRCYISGVVITMASSHLRRYRRLLDLKSSKLHQEYEFHLGAQIVQLKTTRFLCLHDPYSLLQTVELASDDPVDVTLDFSLPIPSGSLTYPHLSSSSPDSGNSSVVYRIGETGQLCHIGQTLWHGASAESLTTFELKLKPRIPEQILRVMRVGLNDLTGRSWHKNKGGMQHPFEPIAEDARHRSLWRRVWTRMGLQLDGRPELTQALRFNAYQLRIAASENPRVSPGARGLTGRAYEGHVFWDSETFMFPYFLYTEPSIARAMLLYRYATLPAAKQRALNLGFKGACYAWESTLSGEDVTPSALQVKGTNEKIPVMTGTQQIHVTADIAYAVWQYWDATQDYDFLWNQGAELLVETARFWVTRAAQAATGKYHINGVIGPDEYHFHVNNNAYTNWMARMNLVHAARITSLLRKRTPDHYNALASRLCLSDLEIKDWLRLANALQGFRYNEDGVIEQFDGFFDLRSSAMGSSPRLRAPIERLLNWRETNGLKAIKQADVLMIPFLFPDALSAGTLRANYRFYEQLTDHASSLSPCVHAAIAARVGFREDAIRYFETSLYTDLLNRMGNTALGIHTGAIGGTWQALVFHMAGIQIRDGMIRTTGEKAVCLPPGVKELKLKLHYRGKQHSIHIRPPVQVAA